jgi:hypothetical protein
VTDDTRRPPAALTHLARERAEARARRDFGLADELRAQIEAAGWVVVDHDRGTTLEPATPPDILSGPEPRYGASERVPSRLAEPDTAFVSMVVVADERPDELSRFLAAARRFAPERTQIVVVANDPSPEQAARLEPGSADRSFDGRTGIEVTWASARLGAAAALNFGLRRSAGHVVVLADAALEPSGDALTPIVEALSDPTVAVAGAFGRVSDRLPRFSPTREWHVTAVDGAWLGFRRSDGARLGPFDERFVVPAHLDEWWSLRLRAGAEGDPPRVALRLDLPLDVPQARPEGQSSDDREPEVTSQAKRNAYRLLDAFRDRPDLLAGVP